MVNMRDVAGHGWTSDRHIARDVQRARANREELAERISRAVPEDGTTTPFEGIQLRRASSPSEPGHGVSFPAVCVVAQGSKEILLGDTWYRYDPAHSLIVTASLPIASQITEASQEQPYLRFLLELDPSLIGSVIAEAGMTGPRRHPAVTAIAVSAVDEALLDAVVRLVRLLDSPLDARVLVPLLKREIVYRLLRGVQGERLYHIIAGNGPAQRIAEAIERLRNNFDQPLRIETIARGLGMSLSSFHYHFKAVTAMSPLQFQKHLRLQEARRLLLSERLDAASAGYRVGYRNAAQFNREYKRFFGAPPMHDVERLRDAATERGTL